MNVDLLVRCARRAVSGLVTKNVKAAAVDWNGAREEIILRYYVAGPPSDEERELCSIAATELLADFWQGVKDVVPECVQASEPMDPLLGWAYKVGVELK